VERRSNPHFPCSVAIAQACDWFRSHRRGTVDGVKYIRAYVSSCVSSSSIYSSTNDDSFRRHASLDSKKQAPGGGVHLGRWHYSIACIPVDAADSNTTEDHPLPSICPGVWPHRERVPVCPSRCLVVGLSLATVSVGLSARAGKCTAGGLPHPARREFFALNPKPFGGVVHRP
jgi:hypothetical protein